MSEGYANLGIIRFDLGHRATFLLALTDEIGWLRWKSGVAQKYDEIVGVVSVRKNRDAESIIDGGIYAICLLRDLRKACLSIRKDRFMSCGWWWKVLG